MFFNTKSKAVKTAQVILELPVESIMTKYVVTTRDDVTVINAATRMVAQDISCLIVTNEDNKPIGIITERDYIKKVPGTTTALKLKVKDVMTKKIVTIPPDMKVAEAYQLMNKHGFRKLVVVDGIKLLGIITQTDFVKLIYQKLNFVPNVLVKKFMTKNVASVSYNSTFSNAKKIMISKDIGALLVKNKNNYVGIFTEYDVVAQFYDQGGLLSIKSPKDIMHPHIKCVNDDNNLFVANRIMFEKKVRRLLVLKNDQVVGIITQTDVAKAMYDLISNIKIDQLIKFDKKSKIISNYLNENLKVYSLK